MLERLFLSRVTGKMRLATFTDGSTKNAEALGRLSVRQHVLRYFASLSNGKVVLWCYLLWYLVTVAHSFDPSPTLWLNALGISAVIGVALRLSVSPQSAGSAARWQTFRLFLMPFCVSSFSSLIKGRGYILILPPRPAEQVLSVGACLAFVFLVAIFRRCDHARRAAQE